MSASSQLDRRSGSGTNPAVDVGTVMGKAAAENFSVATRLLPRAQRDDLLALYGYARLIDDIGDLAPGDRLAQLDWAGDELGRAFESDATHPVFVRLSGTIAAHDLERQPFDDLIAANRQDQFLDRYQSFASLGQYCALSANPVGRLVLAIFGCHDELAREWSDAICTGLQLVEHWQDIAEDHAAGRVYLPLEDLARFGVDVDELAGPVTPAIRRLLAFEVGRARGLIEAGAGLVALFSGGPRFAIAGFIGGGLAQLDAIERAGYDVFSSPIKASKVAVARQTIAHLRPARGRS